MSTQQPRTLRRAAAAIMATVISSATLAQSLPAPPISPAPVVNYEYDAQGNRTRSVRAPAAWTSPLGTPTTPSAG